MPLAHRRPEYPLAGCFPAEPASVSSGNIIWFFAEVSGYGLNLQGFL